MRVCGLYVLKHPGIHHTTVKSDPTHMRPFRFLLHFNICKIMATTIRQIHLWLADFILGFMQNAPACAIQNSITDSFQPVCHIARCIGYIPFINRKPICHNRCLRLQFLNGLNGSRKTAAIMDIKWNDSLP